MNFYDPRTYADATNSLVPLAACEKIGEVKSVYVYDDGEIEVCSEIITADDLERCLFADDEAIDGTFLDDDAFINFTLAERLGEDDVALRKAIIQGVQINDLGIRIGKFQICQLVIVTFSLVIDDSYDEWDWHSYEPRCESRLAKKKGIFLYTEES